MRDGSSNTVQCLGVVPGYQKDILEPELVASLSLILFAHWRTLRPFLSHKLLETQHSAFN